MNQSQNDQWADFAAKWRSLASDSKTPVEDYGIPRDEFLAKFGTALRESDCDLIRSLSPDTYFFPSAPSTGGELSASDSNNVVNLTVTFDYKQKLGDHHSR